MKTRAVIGGLIIIISLAFLLVVASACTTEEDVAEARRQQAMAEALLAEAQARGTVNVLEAQTNAHTEKARQEADITKEMRQFDAAMARQEFSTAMLEMQSLQIALRETREIVEPINYNAEAAAGNSFANGVLIVGLMIAMLGLCGLTIMLGVRSERRFTHLEGTLNGQDAAAQGEAVRESSS